MKDYNMLFYKTRFEKPFRSFVLIGMVFIQTGCTTAVGSGHEMNTQNFNPTFMGRWFALPVGNVCFAKVVEIRANDIIADGKIYKNIQQLSTDGDGFAWFRVKDLEYGAFLRMKIEKMKDYELIKHPDELRIGHGAQETSVSSECYYSTNK